MTTQPEKKTPIEAHLEKIIKDAQKNGWDVKEVSYKDRVRIHATKAPPDKK